jgi:alpha-1,6-mannosyltransferase
MPSPPVPVRSRVTRLVSRASGSTTSVLVIGLSSGVLYLVTYVAQRAIQHAGQGDKRGLPVFPLLLYVSATVCLFGLVTLLLYICRRQGLANRRATILAVAFPVAFDLLFLVAAPNFSIDLLSYITHGYIRVALHGNPYLVPSSAVAPTAMGPKLAAYGWLPIHPVSSYGPLWTDVEAAAVRLFDGVRAQMTALKVVVVASSLGSAALIWLILGQAGRELRLLGTLAYLWNPVIIVELAGEGHNDAIMLLFLLLGVGLALRRRMTSALSVTSLGVLTKYLPLLLVPLHIVLGWRTRRSVGQFLARVAMGVAISSVLGFVLFRPFWAGWHTLTGVRLNARAGDTGSTPTVLLDLLSRIIRPAVAKPMVAGLTGVALVAYVARQASKVSDESSLLQAAAWVALFYVLVSSPTYWPWYAVMPIALLALVPRGWFVPVLLAFSLGSRLAAPLDVMFVHGLISRRAFLLTTWITALGLPMLVAVRAYMSGPGAPAAGRTGPSSARFRSKRSETRGC